MEIEEILVLGGLIWMGLGMVHQEWITAILGGVLLGLGTLLKISVHKGD